MTSELMWMMYVSASALTAISCGLLILHKEYDDGVIGRAALLVIIGVSVLQMHDAYSGIYYDNFLRVVWVEHIAVAVFFVWRYIRLVVRTKSISILGG